MRKYFPVPDKTPADIIVIIAVILIFFLILYILSITSKRSKKNARELMIDAYLNRFGFTYDERTFLSKIFNF
jgi:hypothetical protein